MRDDDGAPEGMTGKEYVEYMNRRKQQTQEKPRNTGSRSQNVKVNGIPANQQARRDLNKKLREQQKPAKDKEEYEKKHPILTKARRVAGKVHGAIQMQYLIRLLPDKTTQDKIREEYEKQIAYFKDKDPQDKTANVKAGLVVVTELIRFITTSFDLLHYDVVGPVCDGQFVSSDVLEIPSIPGSVNNAKE